MKRTDSETCRKCSYLDFTHHRGIPVCTRPEGLCCLVSDEASAGKEKKYKENYIMQINYERIAHMHGVAEWMYEHAEEYGCENKDEMYLLGLIHDIGYLYDKEEEHEQLGAELLGLDTYYGRFVQAHGLSPQEYKDCYGCLDSEIPNEMVLLWTANMIVGLTGEPVGFEKRLADVGEEHGLHSHQYQTCKKTISWLKENRK